MGFFDLFSSDDKKQRLSKIANLVAVASADGVLEENEIDLLAILSDKYGASINEVKQVLNSNGNMKFVPPETNREKAEHIYDLVAIMMADGDISPAEMKACLVITNALGFEPYKAKSLIEKSIEMFKKYTLPDTATKLLLDEINKI